MQRTSVSMRNLLLLLPIEPGLHTHTTQHSIEQCTFDTSIDQWYAGSLNYNHHLPSNLLPHCLAKCKRSAIWLCIHINENSTLRVRWHLFHDFLFCFFIFSSWRWRHYDVIAIFCLLHCSCLSVTKTIVSHNIERCTIKHHQPVTCVTENTCGRQTFKKHCELIGVDKQGNSIPRDYFSPI